MTDQAQFENVFGSPGFEDQELKQLRPPPPPPPNTPSTKGDAALDPKFFLMPDEHLSDHELDTILSIAKNRQSGRILEWEINTMVEVYRAARKVARTLNGGFVRCENCGSQEDTTETDFAPELYEALGIPKKEQ